MRLLLITQKVDKEDDILGFFHRWIEVLARNIESVIVICLEEGEHTLPDNVTVLSLGKEKNRSRIAYVSHFFTYISKYKDSYDTVLIHMNPIYGVLGGLYFRMKKKFVMMWYTHRHVDLKLRIATLLSHVVFTASEYSFRINTNKKKVIGHGIDTRKFVCPESGNQSVFKIIMVGRITRIKNCIDVVHLADAIRDTVEGGVEVQFIGSTSSRDDEAYLHEMKRRINSLNLNEQVKFVGSVPHKDILNYYCNASILINASPDGGVDKVVLEAMASKTPVLVRNEAFREHFGVYGEDLMYTGRNTQEFADKMLAVVARPDKEEMLEALRKKMYEEFDVEQLVGRIIQHYEQASK